MSEFDSKALASAREVMAIIRQPHIGGDAQLLAKIQCLFIEAMEYAAPKSFGNSEQLNSPVTPDGWVAVPAKHTSAMYYAGGELISKHNFNPGDIWQAMLAAAPKQESE